MRRRYRWTTSDGLRCETERGDRYWISQCLEVCIVAQSDSIDEAPGDLDELLEAYFDNMVEMEVQGVATSPIPRVPWYWLRRLRWRLTPCLPQRSPARKEMDRSL